VLKVGQIITSADIPILSLYNLCNYRVSKELQYYIITNNKYDFIDFFKEKNIRCFVVNNMKEYKKIVKNMDMIHFHWLCYNKKEHDFVKGLKVPFIVTLYTPEKLPSSIPFVICPFNFIKEFQGRPRNSTVIYEGIDVKRFSKISIDASLKTGNAETERKKRLVAAEVTTQQNDYFWILMQKFLSENSDVELQIIGPDWQSLNLVKAINNRKKACKKIIFVIFWYILRVVVMIHATFSLLFIFAINRRKE